jgi:murein DD-endopeptidase MepM/ murein hydrolase activator NlpD
MPAPKLPRARLRVKPELMHLSRSSAFVLAMTAFASCTATPPAANTTPSKPVPVVFKPSIAAPIPAVQSQSPLPQYPTQFSFGGDPVQGGIVYARAPTLTRSVTLNGASVMIDAQGYFLIGFDRDAPASANLIAFQADGKNIVQNLIVRPGNWRIENINAAKSGGAATTAEFEARRGPELARIAKARAARNAVDGWRQKFIWPLKGRVSGLFGAQRVYRGDPGAPHGGMDIAGATGTPFVAPADGIVTLAAKDAFTLEGHLLMIDHGMGLNSAFLHCSELLVTEGQFVKQGQVIGKVGMTGRATGPHLHWGMKWSTARVDPKLLVPPVTP